MILENNNSIDEEKKKGLLSEQEEKIMRMEYFVSEQYRSIRISVW